MSNILSLGQNRFEILSHGEEFLGLGRIWIGDTLVRSGRLPLRIFSQSFQEGLELSGLSLLRTTVNQDEIRIHLEARFAPLEVQLLRDHSFDPIHNTRDWDGPGPTQRGQLDLVLRNATDTFGEKKCSGFSYHWEYSSEEVPLFYLMEKASWELDGNIDGVTLYNQSACSAPMVTVGADTFWTTEGELFFLDRASHYNRVMTHNLPRWASHQAFDFQFRGNKTLLGVFERVDLIRSVLRREAGSAELKTFDKHIFDETLTYHTSPKSILLHEGIGDRVAMQNLWTWVLDEVHERARAEFGLQEQPPIPIMGQHYWQNYNIDTSYRDIVPACENLGIKAIFAENFKKSDESEGGLPLGNMCCSQEYEISDKLGGQEKFADYIRRCQSAGIANYMWTNTYVSLAAEINAQQRDERGWYMAMEDTRMKYGGAYTMVASNLDLKNPAARAYWVEAHKKLHLETGLEGYYLDSFYNLFFMPVNYKTGHPRTSWRECLQVLKELQDAGVGFYIESFGPFGQPGHGHPDSYNTEAIFLCYYVGLGDNYTTVPIPGVSNTGDISSDPAFVFYQLAHKCPIKLPLFIEGERIDRVFGPEHRRMLGEYHELLSQMGRRYLQTDGLGVLWHNDAKTQAVLWNFVDRNINWHGKITDNSTGEVLPHGNIHSLHATHTYCLEGGPELPQEILSV